MKADSYHPGDKDQQIPDHGLIELALCQRVHQKHTEDCLRRSNHNGQLRAFNDIDQTHDVNRTNTEPHKVSIASRVV
jgi:hypothetical protein